MCSLSFKALIMAVLTIVFRRTLGSSLVPMTNCSAHGCLAVVLLQLFWLKMNPDTPMYCNQRNDSFSATTKVLVDDNDIRSYSVDVAGNLTPGSVAGFSDTIDSATSDSKGNWLVRSVSRTEQSSNVRTKDFKLLTFVFSPGCHDTLSHTREAPL